MQSKMCEDPACIYSRTDPGQPARAHDLATGLCSMCSLPALTALLHTAKGRSNVTRWFNVCLEKDKIKEYFIGLAKIVDVTFSAYKETLLHLINEHQQTDPSNAYCDLHIQDCIDVAQGGIDDVREESAEKATRALDGALGTSLSCTTECSRPVHRLAARRVQSSRH